MLQIELKEMLEFIQKEIENENIVSIDELIEITAEQIRLHLLVAEEA